MVTDAETIARHAAATLPLAGARLSDEYFYAALPLCAIDAVFSIGVRYEGVRNVVARYCEFRNVPRFLTDRRVLPSCDQQESASQFCAFFEATTLEGMTQQVFKNRQRTSSRNGVLKAEATYRFVRTLRDHGIECLQDVPAGMQSEALEQEIRSIPGQRSGISLRYFWMLAGSDDLVKPDRMVIRYLESTLQRTVAVAEAQALLAAATEILKADRPELTARLLDHLVWQHQRNKA